jgi:hypothetical protein
MVADVFRKKTSAVHHNFAAHMLPTKDNINNGYSSHLS